MNNQKLQSFQTSNNSTGLNIFNSNVSKNQQSSCYPQPLSFLNKPTSQSQSHLSTKSSTKCNLFNSTPPTPSPNFSIQPFPLS